MEGHIARYFKNINIGDTSLFPSLTPNQPTTEQAKLDSSQEISSQITEEKMLPPKGTHTSKRALTSSTSSNSNKEAQDKSQEKTNIKQSVKIPKTEPPEGEKALLQNLEPARAHIQQNEVNYPLSFEQLSEFLSETRGQKNFLEIAEKYTNDTNSLLKMLTDIHGLVDKRCLKIRLTKIKKALSLQPMDSEDLLSDSDVSFTDESSDNIVK